MIMSLLTNVADRSRRITKPASTPAIASHRHILGRLALAAMVTAGGLAAPALSAQDLDERRYPGAVVTPLAYREGFARGEADARAELSRSPARWNDTVSPADRQQFLLGYNDGYNRLSPGRPPVPAISRYYQEGMVHGQRDARNGALKDPSHFHASIPREWRADFTRGYVEAYDREAMGSGTSFYQQGQTQGQRDARNGVPKDPSQYHAPIPRELRADFTRGYVEAYDREAMAVGPRYYQQGMAQGARDARRGVPKDPSRHHAPIPRERRADFTRGYVDAYDLQSKVRPPAPQTVRTYEVLAERYARLDQKAGLRQDDSRHIAEVPPAFRTSFQRAYRAAWRPQPR